MKQLKPFLPSFYSEFLIAGPSNQAQAEKHDSLLLGSEIAEKLQQQLDGEGDLRGPGGEGKGEYQRGLGEMFGFPGDARKMRERSKMKLWREYFIGELNCSLCRPLMSQADMAVHGRNLTRECNIIRLCWLANGVVIRYPPFQRLLQVGLPSRLRGELWEVMSGSVCECKLYRNYAGPGTELKMQICDSPILTYTKIYYQ